MVRAAVACFRTPVRTSADRRAASARACRVAAVSSASSVSMSAASTSSASRAIASEDAVTTVMTLQRWCLPVVTGSVEHPIERLFDRTPVHLSRAAPVKPSTSQHCGASALSSDQTPLMRVEVKPTTLNGLHSRWSGVEQIQQPVRYPRW
ncbi:hypothetical protein [Promicromonospora sp. NFX87]|uniref:hypothetical protein n=1 Tax=Promicromonospora sp. NFX87 TaxID=3402691 RepID=UPI003AFA693E